MLDPDLRRKKIFQEIIDPAPQGKCAIHHKPFTQYEDKTIACIDCVALDAVKNLGIAKGFYPRMMAAISGIEASVIDNMFRSRAAEKGIPLELLFSMLLSGYAHRHSFTIDEVIEKINFERSAIMIIPSM